MIEEEKLANIETSEKVETVIYRNFYLKIDKLITQLQIKRLMIRMMNSCAIYCVQHQSAIKTIYLNIANILHLIIRQLDSSKYLSTFKLQMSPLSQSNFHRSLLNSATCKLNFYDFSFCAINLSVSHPKTILKCIQHGRKSFQTAARLLNENISVGREQV